MTKIERVSSRFPVDRLANCGGQSLAGEGLEHPHRAMEVEWAKDDSPKVRLASKVAQAVDIASELVQPHREQEEHGPFSHRSRDVPEHRPRVPIGPVHVLQYRHQWLVAGSRPEQLRGGLEHPEAFVLGGQALEPFACERELRDEEPERAEELLALRQSGDRGVLAYPLSEEIGQERVGQWLGVRLVRAPAHDAHSARFRYRKRWHP